MGSLIATFVTFILEFLLSVLPVSPFANMRISGQIDTAIGWLNWLIPFTEMSQLMLAWIGVAVLVSVIRFVIDNIEQIKNWALGS